MSALLVKTYTFNCSQLSSGDVNTVHDLNKRLIQRCANSLSREQEISAPEVISYIMGWGDQYISHRFKHLHFGSVIHLLKKVWPMLDKHWCERTYFQCDCKTDA